MSQREEADTSKDEEGDSSSGEASSGSEDSGSSGSSGSAASGEEEEAEQEQQQAGEARKSRAESQEPGKRASASAERASVTARRSSASGRRSSERRASEKVEEQGDAGAASGAVAESSTKAAESSTKAKEVESSEESQEEEEKRMHWGEKAGQKAKKNAHNIVAFFAGAQPEPGPANDSDSEQLAEESRDSVELTAQASSVELQVTADQTHEASVLEEEPSASQEGVVAEESNEITEEESSGEPPPSDEPLPSGLRLRIIIIGARGLEVEQGMEVYCTCEIRSKAKSRFRTESVKSSSRPQWNAEGILHGYMKGDMLRFTVFSTQKSGKDDRWLGSVAVASKVFHLCGYDGELGLTVGKEGQKAGLRVTIPPVAGGKKWSERRGKSAQFSPVVVRVARQIMLKLDGGGRRLFDHAVTDAHSLFIAMDRDGRGSLDQAKIESGLKRLAVGLSNADISAFIEVLVEGDEGLVSEERFTWMISTAGGGVIGSKSAKPKEAASARSKAEASLERQHMVSQLIEKIVALVPKGQLGENISSPLALFEALDRDGKGDLDKVEIHRGLKTLGLAISEENLTAFMQEVGHWDGRIDKEEFLRAFESVELAARSEVQAKVASRSSSPPSSARVRGASEASEVCEATRLAEILELEKRMKKLGVTLPEEKLRVLADALAREAASGDGESGQKLSEMLGVVKDMAEDGELQEVLATEPGSPTERVMPGQAMGPGVDHEDRVFVRLHKLHAKKLEKREKARDLLKQLEDAQYRAMAEEYGLDRSGPEDEVIKSGERMYDGAAYQRERRQELIERREREMRELMPFQPTFEASHESQTHRSGPAGARVFHMHAAHRLRNQRLEEKRKLLTREEVEYLEQNSVHRFVQEKPPDPEQVGERLYNYAEVYAQMKEEKKRLLEQIKERQMAPGWVHQTEAASQAELQDSVDRLYDEHRFRQVKLDARRLELECQQADALNWRLYADFVKKPAVKRRHGRWEPGDRLAFVLLAIKGSRLEQGGDRLLRHLAFGAWLRATGTSWATLAAYRCGGAYQLLVKLAFATWARNCGLRSSGNCNLAVLTNPPPADPHRGIEGLYADAFEKEDRRRAKQEEKLREELEEMSFNSVHASRQQQRSWTSTDLLSISDRLYKKERARLSKIPWSLAPPGSHGFWQHKECFGFPDEECLSPAKLSSSSEKKARSRSVEAKSRAHSKGIGAKDKDRKILVCLVARVTFRGVCESASVEDLSRMAELEIVVQDAVVSSTAEMIGPSALEVVHSTTQLSPDGTVDVVTQIQPRTPSDVKQLRISKRARDALSVLVVELVNSSDSIKQSGATLQLSDVQIYFRVTPLHGIAEPKDSTARAHSLDSALPKDGIIQAQGLDPALQQPTEGKLAEDCGSNMSSQTRESACVAATFSFVHHKISRAHDQAKAELEDAVLTAVEAEIADCLSITASQLVGCSTHLGSDGSVNLLTEMGPFGEEAAGHLRRWLASSRMLRSAVTAEINGLGIGSMLRPSLLHISVQRLKLDEEGLQRLEEVLTRSRARRQEQVARKQGQMATEPEDSEGRLQSKQPEDSEGRLQSKLLSNGRSWSAGTGMEGHTDQSPQGHGNQQQAQNEHSTDKRDASSKGRSWHGAPRQSMDNGDVSPPGSLQERQSIDDCNASLKQRRSWHGGTPRQSVDKRDAKPRQSVQDNTQKQSPDTQDASSGSRRSWYPSGWQSTSGSVRSSCADADVLDGNAKRSTRISEDARLSVSSNAAQRLSVSGQSQRRSSAGVLAEESAERSSSQGRSRSRKTVRATLYQPGAADLDEEAEESDATSETFERLLRTDKRVTDAGVVRRATHHSPRHSLARSRSKSLGAQSKGRSAVFTSTRQAPTEDHGSHHSGSEISLDDGGTFRMSVWPGEEDRSSARGTFRMSVWPGEEDQRSARGTHRMSVWPGEEEAGYSMEPSEDGRKHEDKRDPEEEFQEAPRSQEEPARKSRASRGRSQSAERSSCRASTRADDFTTPNSLCSTAPAGLSTLAREELESESDESVAQSPEATAATNEDDGEDVLEATPTPAKTKRATTRASSTAVAVQDGPSRRASTTSRAATVKAFDDEHLSEMAADALAFLERSLSRGGRNVFGRFIPHLQLFFEELERNDGFVSRGDLVRALRRLDLQLAEEQLDVLVTFLERDARQGGLPLASDLRQHLVEQRKLREEEESQKKLARRRSSFAAAKHPQPKLDAAAVVRERLDGFDSAQYFVAFGLTRKSRMDCPGFLTFLRRGPKVSLHEVPDFALRQLFAGLDGSARGNVSYGDVLDFFAAEDSLQSGPVANRFTRQKSLAEMHEEWASAPRPSRKGEDAVPVAADFQGLPQARKSMRQAPRGSVSSALEEPVLQAAAARSEAMPEWESSDDGVHDLQPQHGRSSVRTSRAQRRQSSARADAVRGSATELVKRESNVGKAVEEPLQSLPQRTGSICDQPRLSVNHREQQKHEMQSAPPAPVESVEDSSAGWQDIPRRGNSVCTVQPNQRNTHDFEAYQLASSSSEQQLPRGSSCTEHYSMQSLPQRTNSMVAHSQRGSACQDDVAPLPELQRASTLLPESMESFDEVPKRARSVLCKTPRSSARTPQRSVLEARQSRHSEVPLQGLKKSMREMAQQRQSEVEAMVQQLNEARASEAVEFLEAQPLVKCMRAAEGLESAGPTAESSLGSARRQELVLDALLPGAGNVYEELVVQEGPQHGKSFRQQAVAGPCTALVPQGVLSFQQVQPVSQQGPGPAHFQQQQMQLSQHYSSTVTQHHQHMQHLPTQHVQHLPTQHHQHVQHLPPFQQQVPQGMMPFPQPQGPCLNMLTPQNPPQLGGLAPVSMYSNQAGQPGQWRVQYDQQVLAPQPHQQHLQQVPQPSQQHPQQVRQQHPQQLPPPSQQQQQQLPPQGQGQQHEQQVPQPSQPQVSQPSHQHPQQPHYSQQQRPTAVTPPAPSRVKGSPHLHLMQQKQQESALDQSQALENSDSGSEYWQDSGSAAEAATPPAPSAPGSRWTVKPAAAPARCPWLKKPQQAAVSRLTHLARQRPQAVTAAPMAKQKAQPSPTPGDFQLPEEAAASSSTWRAGREARHDAARGSMLTGRKAAWNVKPKRVGVPASIQEDAPGQEHASSRPGKPVAKTKAKAKAMVGKPGTRPGLCLQLFCKLSDGAKELEPWQLKRFADLRGFDGSAEEWARDFDQLLEVDGREKLPMTAERFTALIHDSDGPLYCDFECLEFTLMALGTRAELTFSLYSALDPLRQGALGRAEIRRFAELCGFSGTEEEWSLELTALAAKYHWDLAQGVTAKDFALMLNDAGGNGHCSEEEMSVMLMELGRETFA